MKVTRKRESLEKALAEPEGKDGDIAPSLFLRGLSKPIEGMEGGKEFEGHIKGRCRSHSCEDRGGKEEHSYDLDVHDFEHHGKGKEPKKKETTREGVDKAFKKYDEEEAKKKDKK